MIHFSTMVLSLILISVLLSLSSNRLKELVNIMAFQGIMVSLTPLFFHHQEAPTTGGLLILVVMLLIKGILIPGLMYMAVRKVAIKREVEPIIGYHASVFAGLVMIVVFAFVTDSLELALPAGHSLLLTTAMTTLSAGLLLLMGRRKAITQVIGYLMLENGIYLIGTALAKQTHTMYVVEFGVLLDLLVGIMVMGIVIHNINNAFDDVDTIHLGRLKD